MRVLIALVADTLVAGILVAGILVAGVLAAAAHPARAEAVPSPKVAPEVTPEVAREVATLRADLAREVPGLLHPPVTQLGREATWADQMLRRAGVTVDTPQLVVVVDRNPAVEMLSLLAASPDPQGTVWIPIGAARVSTGQAGRRDHYITPVGVFAHTDAILDFRAAGTLNENGIRGLGAAGMRVWDFGWQWAVKGWRDDAEGGDIRLQMHATDPDQLEGRLGRPASEGCVRVSSAMNRFLDRHGVLDADYERVATYDAGYRAVLLPGRRPSPLAGRLLVVVDTRAPMDVAPTQATRPADLPPPGYSGDPADLAFVPPGSP